MEKGKRGRKPKAIADEQNEANVTSTVQAKSRRGRRPKNVYNGYEGSHDFFQSNSDDENIILKLRVSMDNNEEVSFVEDNNDVFFPDAYNEIHVNSFESKPCEIEFMATSDMSMKSQTQEKSLRVIELLKDFEEKNKNNEWPQTTSISCYWCCHKFETPPFGIPVKYINGKFHVFGCFCSLECATAYNLSSKESIDEIWERNNLIHLLSKRIGYKNIVKPAPNRLSLQMFGGHLPIQEYRKFCETSKLININFPPMMTLTQQIEEINESDINNDYKYIPLDTDRINKYKEKIKLKRSKPLTTFENTLDHAMNLKFGN